MTEGGSAPYLPSYQALRERGYIPGENLVVDLWSGPQRPGWTGSNADRDQFARAIVASAPEVIFAVNGSLFGPILMRQTKTIPIVFLATDPVRAGLVTNLAWPAGNLTGFTLDPGREYYSKLLQFLVDAVSSANRVGYVSPRRLWEPAERIVRSAAATLGVTLVPVTRDEPVDEEAVRRVFAALADNRVDAYVRGPGQTGALLQLFADLTMERRLPAIGPIPQLAHLGALMSYEANRPSVFGGVGGYVAKILDGAYPGDLPAQQPTVFDFVINLKTAAALGLTIPPKLMIFATEFIE